MGETVLQKMEICKSFFVKKDGKLDNWQNFTPKFFPRLVVCYGKHVGLFVYICNAIRHNKYFVATFFFDINVFLTQ